MLEFKDIKAGETYNMRVKVISVATEAQDSEVATIPVDKNGKELDGEWAMYARCIASALSQISPENGTKNTEPAPKYDPCRKFRKGDIVVPCSVNGRWGSPVWEDRSGTEYVVTKAEEPLTAHMIIKALDSVHVCSVHAAFFKLVTPVEEMERYYIERDTLGFSIVDRLNVGYVAHYKAVQHPHAEEAAEAECARLNAEHRKEQS